MSTKLLDRLLFVQGGLCFFCKDPLEPSEASVEHLLAIAHGGSNSDDNCVACCKTVNLLLGSRSVKEKIQVVLNQKGSFRCPQKVVVSAKAAEDPFDALVANLKRRGNAKPRTLESLTKSTAALFPKGKSAKEIAALVERLQTSGKVVVQDGKVAYHL